MTQKRTWVGKVQPQSADLSNSLFKFSGQGGWDPETTGALVDDHEKQVELAFRNVDIVLRDAGPDRCNHGYHNHNYVQLRYPYTRVMYRTLSLPQKGFSATICICHVLQSAEVRLILGNTMIIV